jgi:hypothetical protein
VVCPLRFPPKVSAPVDQESLHHQALPGMQAARAGVVHAPALAHALGQRRALCLPRLLQASHGHAQVRRRAPLGGAGASMGVIPREALAELPIRRYEGPVLGA